MGLNQEAMGDKLGLSLSYVNALEKGKKEPSEAVKNHVSLMARALEAGLLGNFKAVPIISADVFGGFRDGIPKPLEDQPAVQSQVDLPPYQAKQKALRRLRTIPLIGWAHAGQAQSYEELPQDWQDEIPTDCPDPNAFGVTLEGDSMETMFHDGDKLTLMPNAEVFNGSLCVVRFKNDGVLLRKIEFTPSAVRLHPLNKDYEIQEFTPDALTWMYRVWGAWTQVFR